MKNIVVSLLLLFSVSMIFSQTKTDDDYYTPAKTKPLAMDRVSATIIAGAGVSFLSSSNNTAFTTYVAPKISYQLNSKFRLTMGMMHYSVSGNTLMAMNNHEALLNNSNHSISGNMVMIGGEYQLNKKLILGGAVMMDVNDFSKNKLNSKAAAFSLEYKVSPTSSIRFETIIEQGQGNYLNSSNPAFDKTNPYYYGYGNNDMFRSMTTGGLGTLATQSLNSSIR